MMKNNVPKKEIPRAQNAQRPSVRDDAKAEKVRREFTLLIAQPKLAYFDNASTTQKPRSVIDAETQFYATMNANVRRGMYSLSENATRAYEEVRQQVRKFVRARRVEEIIFTKGTTESINLVMQTWGRQNIRADDVILLSEMEHHANLVPWQQLAIQQHAELRWIPVTDEGRLDVKMFPKLLDEKVKLVAIAAMSNVLGTINPVKEIVKKSHAFGAKVLVDAAQIVAHAPIDVESWNADFVAFSAHKMYGPTGVGVLYAKRELLEAMPPFLFGGDMILDVRKNHTEWNELPEKFEGGTPNIAGVIGLGAAIAYLKSLDWDWIQEREKLLTEKLLCVLQAVPGITLFGPGDLQERGSVVSFNVGTIHAHDLATVLDSENIAVRSGHHCAQVLMERFHVPAMIRASIAFYNTEEEVDRLPKAIEKARSILLSP